MKACSDVVILRPGGRRSETALPGVTCSSRDPCSSYLLADLKVARVSARVAAVATLRVTGSVALATTLASARLDLLRGSVAVGLVGAGRCDSCPAISARRYVDARSLSISR